MNKITTINLGGYPITIDEDAYKVLDMYLDKINNHFSKSLGCEEIVEDIETRLAELIHADLNGKPIATMKQVKSAIEIMGSPEVLDDFEDNDTSYSHSYDDEPRVKENYRTGRKLFRDKDNKVIGGVCSGLAAYFGIEDPIWIRLIFIAVMFGGGVSVLAYIVLLIIVPEAKTANDRLAMQGKKIDIHNISNIVETEIADLSDSFLDLKESYAAKKKEKSYRS